MSDPPAPSPLGLTLQLLRLAQELSINGLGKKAEVDPAYIWRLERGEKQDPSISVLRKLCAALGISPQEFITRWLAVESAAESGKLTELPPMDLSEAGDLDTSIFAGILDERRQAQVIRDTSRLSWNQITLDDDGRVGKTRRVMVLGRIAAGEPLRVGDGIDPLGEVKTPAAGLPKDPELFGLQVTGDSMIGANIDDHDLVIVSPRLAHTMAGGQVAVCRTYGEEITLKHCWRTNEGFLLRAANPRYPDIELGAGECEVLGVVVRVLKGKTARFKPAAL